MYLRNKPDFWSGIMFVAIGLAFAIGSTRYALGTAARMGPGYFPFWLGLTLALLGAVVTAGAISRKAEPSELERFDWKIAGIIVGSVALCGLVFDYLGVYISVFLLVVASSLASHQFNWRVAIATGFFLMLFVWLAFVKGLGLIFPLWPSLAGH